MTTNSIGDWMNRHRAILILSAIVIFGIFLRFYDLGTKSIWLDEAESIKESALTIQGMSAHSNQPPLYFLILRAWIHLFGNSETAIRSLSAVFGVLSIGTIFMVGKTLFNSRIALIAAFLMSLASFPILYSQTARAYSLLMLLSLLSYWFFVEILKNNRIRWYLAYLAASILMAYTHFYGLFIIASQVIFFFIFFKKYKDHRWKFIGVVVILIITLIPFVLLLKNNITGLAANGFWIPEPGIKNLIDTLAAFSGTGPGIYLLLVLFILLAVFGLFVVTSQESKHSQGKTKRYKDRTIWKMQMDSPEVIALLLLWLAVPILIPFIESRLMTPIYQSKYAIGSLPALLFLAAKGLNNLKWQWAFYSVLIVIVIFSSLGLNQYYKYSGNEPWRDVAQMVESKARPGDVIVLCESYYSDPFDYYYKGKIEQTGIDNLGDAQKFVGAEGKTISAKSGRIWLLLAYNKNQIAQYFVNTYGKNTITTANQYSGISVILFDLSIPKK